MKKLSLSFLYEGIVEDNKKGSMVCLPVDSRIAKRLKRNFQNLKGEFLDTEDFHITLGLVKNPEKYGDKIQKAMKVFSKHFKPLQCKIRSFDFFEPNKHNGNKFVLYAKPEIDDIIYFQDKLVKFFSKNGIKIDNGHFEYKPHITIAYLDEKPELNVGTKLKLDFSLLQFVNNGKKVEVKLG